MSKTAARNLSYYDGMAFMGALKITERKRRGRRTHRKVAAKDYAGKKLGIFKSQKAALTAIDSAFAKRDVRR